MPDSTRTPFKPAYPPINSLAPDFTAPVIGGGFTFGARVRLADLRGERVALCFYPKDDSPGCTKQACAMRDAWDQLRPHLRLFGVSPDPLSNHYKFSLKYGLPFPLISDEFRDIAISYGVWVKKSLYGRKFMGVERTTFVVSPDGLVQAVLANVRPERHLAMLTRAIFADGGK